LRRFNSRPLIVAGATLFVLYPAGVPLRKEFYVLFLNSIYYGIETCIVAAQCSLSWPLTCGRAGSIPTSAPWEG